MKDAEMDQILCRPDEIVPSSGFTESVMGAIQQEASVPPPIPFPWKRALPVLVLAGLSVVGVLAGAIAAFVMAGRASVAIPIPAASAWLPGSNPLHSAVAWTVAALVATLLAVTVSMRLAGGRT